MQIYFCGKKAPPVLTRRRSIKKTKTQLKTPPAPPGTALTINYRFKHNEKVKERRRVSIII